MVLWVRFVVGYLYTVVESDETAFCRLSCPYYTLSDFMDLEGKRRDRRHINLPRIYKNIYIYDV